MKTRRVLAVIVCMMVAVNFASADTIRGIGMDFVTIGHAGNPGDTRKVGANPMGCGAVSYAYRIGKYEVTNAQWNAFTAAAGAPTGNPSNAYDRSPYWTGAQQPTNCVSWYETLQFCNYLTSGDKSKGAYLFSGDNTNPGSFLGINRTAAQATYGTIYFLPNEDEWYKAAYFKSDGSGYSHYSNGLDTIPAADNGWNYGGGAYTDPWNVGTGLQEQNGTYDIMGNVQEWNETLVVEGGPYYGCRGGSYDDYDTLRDLSSASRAGTWQYAEYEFFGFRVASVPIPEPATLLLLGFGAVVLRRKR